MGKENTIYCRMTRKEVSEKFNIAESTIKDHFPRVQDKIKKKHNIVLVKEGRGQSAHYYIKEDFSRALSVFQENTKASLDQKSLKLINWDFVTFLTIIMMPLQVFRGSYEQFLRYAEINVTNENIQHLKKALLSLESKDYVHYAIDKTDQKYFFVGIYKKIEDDLHIGIELVIKCKQLAKKHNKRNWFQLLKLWLAIQFIYKSEWKTFTMEDISNMIGVSANTIKDYQKILQEEAIFKFDKVYVSFCKCLGRSVEANAFYNQIIC